MLSPLQLTSLILITVCGLVVSYALHIPLALGFLLGFIALIWLAKQRGIKNGTIYNGAITGAKRTKEVVWILILVGLLIPAWTASGTIPYLIQLGLSWIHPNFFLTYCFISTLIISMILGSSTGSLSTIGLPLIGIGSLLQIPLPYIAGALVSGAFVGDRTSPLSSAHQLVAACTETSKEEQAKSMFLTTVGAIILSIIFFLGLDQVSGATTNQALSNSYSFEDWFYFHPVLFVPLFLLIGGIIFRMKTRYAFLLGIGCAVLIGSFYQQVSIREWIHYLLFGYNQTSFTILHGKGLLQMGDLIVFIALTGAFNGILEETNMIQPYFQKVMGKSLSMGTSTWRIGLFGFGMACISCNQTLPIIISGRNFLPVWTKRFAASQLSRVITDTSLVFAGMIPWNMLAIVCSTILGVPVIQYVPFAIFLWILPILTTFLSYLYDKRKIKRVNLDIQINDTNIQ